MRILSSILVVFILQVNSGHVLAQQKKLDSLLRVLDSLEKKPQSLDVDTNKVLVMNEVSRYLLNFKIDEDKALSYAGQALALAEKNKWNRGQVESHFSIASVYEDKNKDTLAIDSYNKIIAIAKARKVRSWEANSLHRIGELYFNRGNYPVALDHFLQALKINEELKRNLYIADNQLFLGHVYAQIGDYPNALKNYEQSLEKYLAEKNKYWVAINLQSIAVVYSNQKEYAKAIEYYSRILDMLKGNKYSVYLTFIDMGNVYRHQLYYSLTSEPDTTWARSFDYYSRALEIANEIGDESTAGVALNGIGWLYLKKSNIKDADVALSKALQLLEINRVPENIMDCYLNISQLDSMKGNWKRSLEYYKLYATMQDSLFDNKKSREMANLEVKYATGKKQDEIEVLNKDNELKTLRIEQQQKNIYW